MFKKRKVNEYIETMTKYVDGVDTPNEVRQQTNYVWLVMMTDALHSNRVPMDIAAKAAASMTVDLPYNFHIDFQDDFVELVRLMSKSLTVLYHTVEQDFAPQVVESVFLSLADDAKLELHL